MFARHLRLGKDVEEKQGNGGSFVTGSGAYDVYKGKKDGKPVYNTVWINFIANDRQADFLKNYGKKGSVLKFVGEIEPGNAYKDKDGKLVSTINLRVETVGFSEVRSNNSEGQTNNNAQPSTSSKPKQNESTSSKDEDMDEIFGNMWDLDSEETA